MTVSEGLVEQHIHGCFGIDFMTCSVSELIEAAQNLAQCGVTAFFPTIMTDEMSIIKNRIKIVKEAVNIQIEQAAQIAGIHLEGPFINPEKAGIHQKKYIQPLNVEIFKQIEDNLIKIITIAPELDKTGGFIKYLKSKNIKISAGHTIGTNLTEINQVTHLYNAMGSFNHRLKSTVVSALCNDEIYTEIIADSKHVNDDVLKITFKQKPIEKILLVSDALPLAHSTKEEHIFANQTIYNNNGNLVNKDGTIAGSSMLLCDMIENVTNKKLLTLKDAIKTASSNLLKYHNIKNNIKIYWDKFNKITKVEFI